jgi:aspartyl-tRNA(Asn)/glutamyl-tRNA(Gln) amidotransferase subunit C
MFSREEILRVAKLARLELSSQEVERYQKQLGRVLDYVKELETVAVDEGTVKHVPRDAVAFRGDTVINFSNTQGILANAPSLEEGGFSIPTVVEHE